MDGWIANLYKMLGLEKEKATAAQKPLSPDASQEEKVSSDGASEQKSSTAAESGAETAVSKISGIVAASSKSAASFLTALEDSFDHLNLTIPEESKEIDQLINEVEKSAASDGSSSASFKHMVLRALLSGEEDTLLTAAKASADHKLDSCTTWLKTVGLCLKSSSNFPLGDKSAKMVERIEESVDKFLTAVENIKEAFGEVYESIKTDVKEFRNLVGSNKESARIQVSTFLQKHAQKYAKTLMGKFVEVVQKLGRSFDVAKVPDISGSIKDGAGIVEIKEAVKKIAQDVVRKQLDDMFKGVQEAVKEASTKLFNLMPSDIREVIKGISSTMSSLCSHLQSIGGVLANVQSSIFDVEGVLTTISRNITKHLQHLGKLLSEQTSLGAVANPAEDSNPKKKALVKDRENLKNKIESIKGAFKAAGTLLTNIDFDKDVLEKASAMLEKTRAELKDALNQVTSHAVDELNNSAESIASSVGLDLSEGADALGDLLDSAGGIMKDAMVAKAAKSPSASFQVREVAVLCLKQIAASGSGGELHAAVTKALTHQKAFEPNSRVKSLLNSDQKTAKSLYGLLNKPLVLPSGGDGDSDSDDEEEQAAAEKAAWLSHQNAVAQSVTKRLAELDTVRAEAEVETDLVRKAQLLAQCRLEQKALSTASSNIKDVGAKLDVVVGFLDSMNGKLDAIGGQLSSLQNEVEAMHDDLKRLTGRPVLEEIRENVERRYKKQSMHLRQHVFIDPTCCGENPSDGTFVPREKENNKKTVVVDAFKEFMKRTDKNILLLSGSAGSGKTTAVEVRISSQCTVTTAAQSNSFPPSFTSIVSCGVDRDAV